VHHLLDDLLVLRRFIQLRPQIDAIWMLISIEYDRPSDSKACPRIGTQLPVEGIRAVQVQRTLSVGNQLAVHDLLVVDSKEPGF
jgi:hypothetical protein